MPLRYYSTEDYRAIQEAQDFQALAKTALLVLRKKPRLAVMVCGPITTGGFGLEQNKLVFQRAIEVLVEEEDSLGEFGWPVFNQWPLESAIDRLRTGRSLEDYCHDILHILYAQIFRSGLVRGGIFLPGWESSTGAQWERQFLQDHNLSVEKYPEHLYQRILMELRLKPESS